MTDKNILIYKIIQLFEQFFDHFNWNITPNYKLINNNVIVENLKEKQRESITKEEYVKEILNVLVKLHGTSIAFEEKAQFQLNDLIKDNSSLEDWIKEDLNYIWKQTPNNPLSNEYFKNKFELFFKNFKIDKIPLKVLSHGDLISSNIWYENRELVNVKLINFETCYKPIGFDVLFFIYNSTQIDDDEKGKFLENYLQYYYNNLKQELMKLNINIDIHLTWQQFEEFCRKILPVIKLLLAIRKVRKLLLENELDNNTEVLKEIDNILTNSSTITIEDCYKIVNKKLKTTDYTIINYQMTEIIEKKGFLGEHAKLKIKIEHENQKFDVNFFVKMQSNIKSQREFSEDLQAFFKESKFFTKYLKLLKLYNIAILNDVIPECYLALDDILVFDDITLKGYEVMNSRTTLNPDYVRSGLEALAKLHASCFILEELITKDKQQTYRLTDDYQNELNETFYDSNKDTVKNALFSCTTGFNRLIDEVVTDNQNDFKEFVRKAINNQQVCVEPSKKYRNTICHGDLWTNNLMFHKTNDEVNCILLDFQTYRYSPPAQDVLAFIRLVTDKVIRDDYLDNFLSFYYNELKENLYQFGIDINQILKVTDFYESLKFYKQFALIQTVTHYQVILLSIDLIKELFTDPTNDTNVLFRNRYDFIRKVCNMDPIYKQRISEAVLEVEEFYKNQQTSN